MPELDDKLTMMCETISVDGRIKAVTEGVVERMKKAAEQPENPFEVFKKCVIVEDILNREGDVVDTKYTIDVRGCADYLLNHYNIITFKDTQESFIYDGGIYVNGLEPLIKNTVKKIIKDAAGPENIFKTFHVKEITLHIQAASYRDRRTIDPPVCLFPVTNGIVDLTDGLTDEERLLPPVAEYFFTWRLPVNWNPKAVCPKFMKFLNEVVCEKDVLGLQEFFGYCLARHHHFQKAFMLVGDGANGKSTVLGVLKALLGRENIASIPLQSLETNRFAAANLAGKLANIHADLPDKSLYQTGTLKMLTGGDMLTAERKFKEGYSFENTAKLIFSCNKLPEAKDDTSAFFRRWVIINFPNRFPPDKADPKLLNKLTTPDELSGVLNWALEGLKRLEVAGEFSSAITADEMAELYERMSDSLAAFVQDCVEHTPDSRIGKEEFYAVYAAYCRQNKLPPKSKDLVGKSLAQYVNVISERPEIGDKRMYVWKGIKVKGFDAFSGQTTLSAAPPPSSSANDDSCVQRVRPLGLL